MKTAFQIAVSMTQAEIQAVIENFDSEISRLDGERMLLMQRRKEYQQGLANRRLRDRCSR